MDSSNITNIKNNNSNNYIQYERNFEEKISRTAHPCSVCDENAIAFNRARQKVSFATKKLLYENGKRIGELYNEPSNRISDLHNQIVRNRKMVRKHTMMDETKLTPYNVYTVQIKQTNPTQPKLNYNPCLKESDSTIASTSKDNNETDPYTNAPTKAEKTTFCRPIVKQEFIFKAMERNCRLQMLVSKLAKARKREKEREAWNNYINELKNKHGVPPKSMSIIDIGNSNTNPDIYCSDELRIDINQYQNLLGENYVAINDDYSNERNYSYPSPKRRYNMIRNENVQFNPIPLGKLYAIKKGYPRLELKDYFNLKKCEPDCYTNEEATNSNLNYNYLIDNDENKYHTISADSLKRSQNMHYTKNSLFINNNNSEKSDGIKLKSVNEEDEISHAACSNRQSEKRDLENTFRNMVKSSSEKKFAFAKIEHKIDNLIWSINEFIAEMKTKHSTYIKNAEVSCTFDKKSLTVTGTDPVNFLTKELFCGLVHDSSKPYFMGNEKKKPGTLEDILYEELSKSDQAKRDIEKLLGRPDQQRTVKVTLDVPTKERSTEVTNSLSNSKENSMRKIESDNTQFGNRLMTIAVNTDPLGVLALLRISTETFKRALSFVPTIDYTNYLTRFQLQFKPSPQFICNVCGAAFERSSQLSDHIEKHYFGKVRNCCICRNSLDQDLRKALFGCQYCGLRFTRAYCRELHEQDCAKKSGKHPEVDSSHMILQ